MTAAHPLSTEGKLIVFCYAALDMSRDSLGYDRGALKANADGTPMNFQLHQRIKSSVSLPLTTAVAAQAADSAIQVVLTGLLLPL